MPYVRFFATAVLGLSALLFVQSAFGQQVAEAADEAAAVDAGPRPVTAADYGKWESIRRGALAPDGRWLAYAVTRVDGSSELRVRMLATEEVKTFAYGRNPTFSADGDWLAFAVGVSEAEREKLQKQKKPVRNGLGLLSLRDGADETIDAVQSFAFSDDGRFLVMRRYAAEGRKSGGSDLVLRDLATGVDTNFGNVSAYAFNDDGLHLAMTIDAEDKAGNGVQLFDAAHGTLRTLDSHGSKYLGLTWRKDAGDLAVMRTMDAEKDEDVSHTVVAWRGLTGDAPRKVIYAHESDADFPADLRVVDYNGLVWSEDGATLFFAVKPWEKKPKALAGEGPAEGEAPKEEPAGDSPKKDAEPAPKKGSDEDAARPLRETLDKASNVEVWHADDIDIIPRQKRTLAQDERRAQRAALWLDDARIVIMGAEPIDRIELMPKQKRALGRDNTPYETQKRFGPTLNDLYVIDVADGAPRKFLEGVKFVYGGDPNGRYLLYVQDGHFWTYDFDTSTPRNLTAAVDTPFVSQEQSSLTDEKRPYGVGGWTEDGRHVLLYDRYDMYLFAADGSDVERLTIGAMFAIRHRRAVLDPEDDEFVPRDKPMWVSLYGDRTKKSGYGRLQLGERLETLAFAPASIGGLTRAKDDDTYLWTVQTFDDAPDFFVGDSNLANARRVSDTNPFQSDYAWGHAELVDYKSRDGHALQGALFYPANYEPGRTYPMIVDIYELRSQGLHRYVVPSERRAYNASVFTAEGYFVYTPDIVYRPQNPGLSAVDCVVPAVEAVLAKGMVDRERIGLVGHSWGAYQTAFIVTQTDLFAAGIAGAPLTNMMSMSMSIYWNSGQSNAWIFHESQGRMDRPFWQDVETFIKNSPIFSIDRMNTPLLVAFGDDDGAVDFNQGVEMYNAARLARKQFVLLVYPGENHGLRQKENQVDYHYRIREWFGHYLKGDDAPKWITDGEPWKVQKERQEKK